MRTKFILSLDCEGKWGVADKLSPEHRDQLSQERLQYAYERLLWILREYQIPATFAIVGLFKRSKIALRDLDWQLLRQQFPYLELAYQDLFNGSGEGWDGDWAVERIHNEIANGLAHEIGSHGGTHTPFDRMDKQAATLDLSIASNLEGNTFIYPRNKVAHQELLNAHEVLGYRSARKSSPMSRLIDEINLFQRGEPIPKLTHPQIIPAGYFINWKSGVRRCIPTFLSRARYRAMFSRTPKEDHVIHFWSHPENFASSPKTFDVLEALLCQVARARDAGDLEVVTQRTFCYQLKKI